ncbi:MAG: TonB-dependent receptor plug domain-containing protein [Hyphomicrobiaceae bacterium]
MTFQKINWRSGGRRVAAQAALVIATLASATDADAETQLPGIVIESATLSRPAPRPKARAVPTQPAQASSQNQSANDGGAGGGQPEAPSSANTAAAGGTGGGNGGDSGGVDGYPVNTTGSAVSVVTSRELANLQVRNAAEALRSLPGVSVNHGGSAAGQTQVRLRGAEASQTLVLIDGVVANQPGTGEFDFSNLPADQIEQIEVLRGAQSGLYGSGAIGGVINIITKRGKGPPQASIWVEGGSFKTVESGLSVSGGNDKAHVLMSYSVRNTNGFNISQFGDETDAAQHRNFIFNGGITPTRDFSLDFIVRNVEKHGDRDNDKLCCTGLSQQVDSFSNLATSFWLAGVQAKLLTFDGRLQHRLAYNYTQTRLDDTDVSAYGTFLARNDNKRGTASYLATLSLDDPALTSIVKHSLTGLVEYEQERFNQVTGDDITRERERTGYAGEYQAEFFKRLTVTANVRRDDNDTFQDYTTWRTTASLALTEWGLRPHASYGTGVKLPSMIEQFGQFANFIPNPDLVAEESQGWDAGLEISFDNRRAVLDVTYFDANLQHEIVTRFRGYNATVANLAGESTRRGVEVSAQWRPVSWLTLGAAYTYLNALDDQDLHEIRRPRDSGRLQATVAFDQGRGTVTAAAAYNGRTPDLAFDLPFFRTQRVILDDYWLGTIAARYKIRPGVEVFGRIENAFDANYQEIYGFETAGIAAYAGMKLTFGGDDGVHVAR